MTSEKSRSARERAMPTHQDPLIDTRDDDLPPAYSAPLTPSAVSSPPLNRSSTLIRATVPPGAPLLPFATYVLPEAVVSTDQSTTTLTDSSLCRSPQAFAKVLSEQVALVPVPEIRIRGTHSGRWTDELDFDIRLNMVRYFFPEGRDVVKDIQLVKSGRKKFAEGAGVEEWAKVFCKDSANDKSFTITRKLTNWDREYIQGRLQGLVQSLSYKGRVEITFPVAHHITILKPAQSFGAALRSTFIGSDNKYELEICWPYANCAPGEDSDGDEGARRTCAVRSETGWLRDWRSTIRAAILARKRGWVGTDDWMEMAMRGPVAESVPLPWGEPGR